MRGYDHPCFECEYDSFAQVKECLERTEDAKDCLHLQRGGSWWDCSSGHENWNYKHYLEWREEKGPDEGEWEQLKRERARLLKEVAWWKSRKEPMYKISACYFPGSGVAELTFERVDDGATVMLTVPLAPEDGARLVDVIGPCMYYTAKKREG